MSIDIPEDADYDIEPELRARHLLEQHTGWKIVINRNEDRYGTDLECYQWHLSDGEWARKLIGYVEVEQGDKWYGKQIPDNWVYYSFLERKVHAWDSALARFDGLVNGGEKTVYLKFNQEYTNCFAASVRDIHRDGSPTKRSDGSRTGSFLKLSLSHEAVHTGIDGCARYIRDYLTKQYDNSNLSDYQRVA